MNPNVLRQSGGGLVRGGVGTEIMAVKTRGMEPVARLEVYACGQRGHLHTRTSLAAHLVSDLPSLLSGAQKLNPAIDAYALVRAIWRLGSRAVKRNNERGVPLSAVDLPLARKVNELLEPQNTTNAHLELKKWRSLEDHVSGLRPSRI